MSDETIYTDPELYERQRLPDNYYMRTLNEIIVKYDVKTALDLGCGLGVDVAMMLEADLDVYGVDGAELLREAVLFPPERYIVRDLTHNLSLSADLIWCREVAEHIEPRHASTLVTNITNSAAKVIYFTAAHPGQVGHRHVNLRPRKYWTRRFNNRGWRVDTELTELNREHPNEDDRLNGMVLCPVT
jgi:SAM-dependent methyltransferase